MGNFPTEWEILHDFCGMGVHGFDDFFFVFLLVTPQMITILLEQGHWHK
jgi:hypothetical protein